MAAVAPLGGRYWDSILRPLASQNLIGSRGLGDSLGNNPGSPKKSAKKPQQLYGALSGHSRRHKPRISKKNMLWPNTLLQSSEFL